MVINWYGEGCFRIQVGGLTILTDPFSSSIGLTPPRFRADITIKTLAPYPPAYEETSGALVSGPGEYEIKGAEISGWPAPGSGNKNFIRTIFLLKIEDFRIGLLGHLQSMPDASVIEKLGKADLLFVPAGGAPFLSQSEAAKLVKQLHPRIAVASFFKIKGLSRKSADAAEFLRVLGQKAEPAGSLTVKKKDLPVATKVAVLEI